MLWELSAAADKVIYTKASEVGHAIPQTIDWTALLGILVYFIIYIAMFVPVVYMANQRNRDAATWVMVSIFTTPLPMMLLLLLLGKAKDKKKK